MAISRPRRVAGGGRHAAAAHLQRASASCATWGSSAARCRRFTRRSPSGSSPVINAIEAGLEFPEPVKPDTIAKSLAIGNPADGFQVVKVVKETGGAGAQVERRRDPRRRSAAGPDGRHLHGAGGRHDARRRRGRSSSSGVIKPNESVVVCITGNGYKTAEVMFDRVARPTQIGRSLADFERVPRVAIEPPGRRRLTPTRRTAVERPLAPLAFPRYNLAIVFMVRGCECACCCMGSVPALSVHRVGNA